MKRYVILLRDVKPTGRNRVPIPDAEPSKLYFTLFAERPDPQRLAALLATNVSPERLLKIAATTRNFNTMNNLVELSA